MTRICTHPEHAQYGLGHVPGPPLAIEYAAPAVALPATYARTVNAPVLNQGSEPWCEPYTAATGRVITQPPVGQDTAWSETDLATRTGASPNGTTTAKIEAVLLSPGALCDAGPDSGLRKPVASCQNIATLSTLKSALMAEQFVGLAVNWYESWFTPKTDGTLPAPDYVAGGHIFAIVGWDDSRAALHCQNSWGTSWGVGGFFWLPYAYLESPLSAYTQISEEPMPLPLGTPTGIARVGTDSAIKLITTAGSVSTTPAPLGCDVVVYGETTVAGFDPSGTSKVWRIAYPTELWLLQRNATYTPIAVDVTHSVTLGVDGVAVYTVKV